MVCQTPFVPAPDPEPTPAELPEGVVLDIDGATIVSPTLLAGGVPWRLLRLSDDARETVARWRAGARLAAPDQRLARLLVDRGLARARFAPDWNFDRVDVVVPVRDDADALDRLLAALAGFSVTVVDDGSSDGAAIARCAADHGAHLVRLEENRGPAGARNAGARATSRPWIWFVDVDVDLEDALALGARLLASGGDPRLGAVAPRVRGARGDGARARFERVHGPLDLGPTSGLVAPRTARAYVPSACLLVRRAALGDGFDETLRVGEDVDLVWRLGDAGWLVRYDADLVVGHRPRTTWRAWWSQRVGYGTSAAALARRHGTRLAPVVLEEATMPVLGGLVTGSLGLATAGAASLARRIDRQLPADLVGRRAFAARLWARAIGGTVGGVARALVRTYAPLLVGAALVPRLRRRVALLVAVGTLWRWRGRGRIDARDVPLALADDAAYGAGVWLGAWYERDRTAFTPDLRASARP